MVLRPLPYTLEVHLMLHMGHHLKLPGGSLWASRIRLRATVITAYIEDIIEP